ncbi:MAG: YitT family protein [Anaerolineales bacterium]|uniref:YitT family protein n=1 Tax=Candidatus Desulfolinea nitratireducens TaxID=2841698 RepID=A0A8J6NSM6_9CHLR|nr:YitT family protein [Candidatus Desulfolinea nitratireducens]
MQIAVKINNLRLLLNELDWRLTLRSFLLLTGGSLISAINLNLFLIPWEIAPSGLSGLAIVINKFTAWPIGFMILVMNLPLMFIGFKYLGRFNFLIRTFYVVLVSSLAVDFLAPIFPAEGIVDDLMLNALYGAVVGGIGTGLIYRGQGTGGGTGILGRVLQFKTGLPISQLYLYTDGFIVFLAGLVFGWDKALYALVTLFIWGIAADQILEGPSVVRTATIITDRPKDVSEAVFSHLRLGITSWPAQGLYTEKNHTVLFFAVSRPKVDVLKSVVLEADPLAFIVIAQGHHTVGGTYKQMQ